MTALARCNPTVNLGQLLLGGQQTGNIELRRRAQLRPLAAAATERAPRAAKAWRVGHGGGEGVEEPARAELGSADEPARSSAVDLLPFKKGKAETYAKHLHGETHLEPNAAK